MGYHLRVKICGVTRPACLDAAVQLGADGIGLNFHPPSPRSVTLDEALRLVRELPPWLAASGVFVQKTVEEVRPLLVPLGRVLTIQVHGGPAQVIDPFPFHYVPAFQVRDAGELAAISHYLDACRAAAALPSAILVDGYAAGLSGGTGQKAPWRLLADFRPGVPLILAGGLTPDNVAEAVRLVRPWAVDVASGVESSPGVKDPERMRRFILEARAAAAGDRP